MRIYFLDKADRIARGEWIVCRDEAEARVIAREMLGAAAAVEIWQGARMILRLEQSAVVH